MTVEEAKASREEARAKGLKTYQGRTCKQGHTERYTNTGQCLVCHCKWVTVWNHANFERKQANTRAWKRNNPKKSLLMGAKGRAKQTVLDFSITQDDLVWPEYCPVLGLRLKYGSSVGNDPASASLDRLDNNRGYVPGNVCVISLRANRLKGDATPEELQALADYTRDCSKSKLRLLA